MKILASTILLLTVCIFYCVGPTTTGTMGASTTMSPTTNPGPTTTNTLPPTTGTGPTMTGTMSTNTTDTLAPTTLTTLSPTTTIPPTTITTQTTTISPTTLTTQTTIYTGTTMTTTTYAPLLVDGRLLIGGSLVEESYARIERTSDGGYIMTGKFKSTDGDFMSEANKGNDDIVIIKLTNTGAFDPSFAGDGILTIGGSGADEGEDIHQTADGGYIVSGNTASTDGDFASETARGGADAVIIKLTAAGALDTTFDGNGIKLVGSSAFESQVKVGQAIDGNFILTGIAGAPDGDFALDATKDFFVVKLTQAGAFDPSFDGNGVATVGGYSNIIYQLLDLEMTMDGGCILVGSCDAVDGDFASDPLNGFGDLYAIKLTSSGALDTTFNGDGILRMGASNASMSTSVQQLTDGSYILAGVYSPSNGDFAGEVNYGNGDAVLIKLTAAGTLDNTFGGGNGMMSFGGTGFDEPRSCRQSIDGGFIVTGHTTSADSDFAGEAAQGNQDIFAAKFDASGVLDTAFDTNGLRLVGGSTNDVGQSIVPLPSGQYVVLGNSDSSNGDFLSQGAHGGLDFCVMLLNADGSF